MRALKFASCLGALEPERTTRQRGEVTRATRNQRFAFDVRTTSPSSSIRPCASRFAHATCRNQSGGCAVVSHRPDEIERRFRENLARKPPRSSRGDYWDAGGCWP